MKNFLCTAKKTNEYLETGGWYPDLPSAQSAAKAWCKDGYIVSIYDYRLGAAVKLGTIYPDGDFGSIGFTSSEAQKLQEDKLGMTTSIRGVQFGTTGTLANWTRDELRALIEAYGGILNDQPRYGTRYFIVGVRTASLTKVKKAEANGTEIINEQQFIDKFLGGVVPTKLPSGTFTQPIPSPGYTAKQASALVKATNKPKAKPKPREIREPKRRLDLEGE